MSQGARLIAAERKRQLKKWSRRHDDLEHDQNELAIVAAIMACKNTDARVSRDRGIAHLSWHCVTKVQPRVKDLIVAGALIAADIDRLLREAKKAGV